MIKKSKKRPAFSKLRSSRLVWKARSITEKQRPHEEYKWLFENAPVGFFLLDSKGLIKKTNPVGVSLLGGTRNAVIGARFAMYLSPGYQRALRWMLISAAKSGMGACDARLLPRSGPPRWVRIEAANGGRETMVVCVIDMTEKVHAEEALREGEEMYRSVVENSLQGLAIIQDGRIVLCNEALLRMSGFPREETYRMTQEDVLATVDPEDRPRVLLAMREITARGKPRPAEVIRLMSKDGHRHWVEVLAAWLVYKGKPALQMSYVDVTGKVAASESLIWSERKYRQLAETLQEGIWTIDLHGVTTFVNPRMAEMLGYPPHEIVGKPFLDFVDKRDHVTDAERMLEMWGGSTHRHKGVFLRRDGGKTHVEIQGSPLFGEDGKPSGIIAAVMDDTERRKTEEAYRSLVDHSLQGFAIIQDGQIVFANQALADLSGYSVKELLRFAAADMAAVVHEEDRGRVLLNMAKRLESGNAPTGQIFRFLRKDGSTRWVETLSVRMDFNSRPALQVSYRDVTESREAEAALLESEAIRRSLIDRSTLGIVMIDDRRKCIEWNSMMERITGMVASEVLGQDAYDLRQLLGEEQASEWDRIRMLIADTRKDSPDSTDGDFAYEIELPILTRDGVRKTVRVKLYTVNLMQKLMFGALVEDVTTEKAAEKELHDTHVKMRNLAGHLLNTREEERKRIAQGLHDELGQTLTALKMDLHWLEKRLAGQSAAIGEKMKGLVDLADQTIGMVQRISADLRPRMLDDLGLASALDWLGRDFARHTGLACTVFTDFPKEAVGGNAATSLYRIVQEALTNVALHSNAKRATVQVRLVEGLIEVRIEDNGIGIIEKQVAAPGSYGLIGIRERAEGLGGVFSISGESGRGTTLVVSIPIHRASA